MALERELETFQRMHAELIQHEGKYAVIAGDDLIGVFDSHSDALSAGYKARGLEPFLVKQVSAINVIANYTRDIRPQCTAQAS